MYKELNIKDMQDIFSSLAGFKRASFSGDKVEIEFEEAAITWMAMKAAGINARIDFDKGMIIADIDSDFSVLKK